MHKVHAKFGACGPPEARQLRVGQRLGQLEDARHVLAEVGQNVAVEAVSEGEEQLSASKAADAKASRCTKSMQGSGAGRGGTGALQRRDLGLVEHSRDRLAALGTKHVVCEAAQVKGQR